MVGGAVGVAAVSAATMLAIFAVQWIGCVSS
jgi:hypothetical protein